MNLRRTILAASIILITTIGLSSTAAAVDKPGDVVANYSFVSEVISADTTPNAVYLTGVDYNSGVNSLVKLDPDTYEEIWSMDEGVGWSDEVVAGPNDEYVYYGDKYYTYRIDASDGSIEWNKTLEALEISILPGTSNILVMSNEGNVTKVDRETGNIVSEHQFSGMGSASSENRNLEISSDGSIGFIAAGGSGGTGATFKAFNTDDYSVKWTISSLDGMGVDSHGFDYHNGSLYVGALAEDDSWTGVKKVNPSDASVQESYTFLDNDGLTMEDVEVAEDRIAIAIQEGQQRPLLEKDFQGNLKINYTDHTGWYDLEYSHNNDYLHTAAYEKDSRKIVSSLYNPPVQDPNPGLDKVDRFRGDTSDSPEDTERPIRFSDRVTQFLSGLFNIFG